ncbi:hypothetical protein [Mesorhizobium sp.]|uniref:hypothetical protein n=1 Tax=Mesorhizobium sp. TaxID=1871066 RepID=UPI0011F6A88F|nr:hypothetical protein [Mesorhizobium sp.]TIX28783.1 MAG: hypothetical protein E5V35_00025 [Mesorhizobium sp.]
MAIRLRTVDGVRVALCAAETDTMAGDVYLDDSDHYALAAKFRLDWKTMPDVWPDYPTEWATMATQKKRDAETEIAAWSASMSTGNPAMQPSGKEMQDACDRFNERHAVGDIIRCWTGLREGEPRERRIRYPACILSGHTAVVYVYGVGAIALTHVKED